MNIQSTTILALAIALAGTMAGPVAAPAAAVELVTNGGFESGTLSGWTRSGGLSFSGVNAVHVEDGSFAAYFSQNRGGSIAQTVQTLGTGSYEVSFWLSHVIAAAVPLNSFSVSLGGTNLLSLTSVGALAYTRYSFIVAGGSASELKFTFLDSRPTNFYLDNVSVTAVLPTTVGSVPEPAAWTMMIAGFGLVGAALRRRHVELAA